jgi:methionyl-tRNA formyltransferase
MIVIAAYRDWAISVFNRLSCEKYLVKTKQELNDILEKYDSSINCIIFIGWSDFVPTLVLNKFLCLCFHPSDLPLYRGGSPIQNQIIDGITETKGTLFKMTEALDAGPIYAKHELDLKGNIKDIFRSLENVCLFLLEKFFKDFSNGNKIIFYDQNNNQATFFKRRTPEMSEITLDDFSKLTGVELYNKIRALGDPYPNAFFYTVDGKRLLIKNVEIE